MAFHCILAFIKCSVWYGVNIQYCAKEWGLSKFFLKIQIVSIFGFADYRVSVATTLFCHHSVKETVDDTLTNGYGCVPTILYIQKKKKGSNSNLSILCLALLEDHRRTVVYWWIFTSDLWGDTSLICNVCQCLWCKYSQHGWFQATRMKSLNDELGRGMDKPSPTHHCLRVLLKTFRLWVRYQQVKIEYGWRRKNKRRIKKLDKCQACSGNDGQLNCS